MGVAVGVWVWRLVRLAFMTVLRCVGVAVGVWVWRLVYGCGGWLGWPS